MESTRSRWEILRISELFVRNSHGPQIRHVEMGHRIDDSIRLNSKDLNRPLMKN
jgi:hypothetical protein